MGNAMLRTERAQYQEFIDRKEFYWIQPLLGTFNYNTSYSKKLHYCRRWSGRSAHARSPNCTYAATERGVHQMVQKQTEDGIRRLRIEPSFLRRMDRTTPECERTS